MTAGWLARRRPIIGGRLIITLVRRLVSPLRLRLIISLLLGLTSPLRLRLVGGLGLPVECSGHATPSSSEQTADSRPSPGIAVIDGGSEAGPQGRTQTGAGVKAGILSRRGASGEQTQTQQSYQYPLLAQAQAPKALS
jgi:hypothetical protein